MTTLMVVLGLVLAVGAGFAVALWRLLRFRAWHPRPEFFDVTRPALLAAYQPLGRLFAEEDFAFLASQAGFRRGMIGRLRRDRRRILRLYLGDLRADFQRLYTLCRTLAPYSQDPNFPALIMRQALRFYGLLLVVELRLALGWFLPIRLDTSQVVAAFARIEEASRICLERLAARPAAVRA